MGNPWLPSNAAKWGLVDEPCRQLVTAWLKRDLMKLFFELLSQNGRNEKHRFVFRARYLEEISHMYFGLGSLARQKRSADFRSMKNKMDDFHHLISS